MPDISVLTNELTADPLGKGYSGMNDKQAATSMNDKNRKVAKIARVKEVREYLSTQINGTGNAQRSVLDMIREFAEAGTVRGTAPTVSPTQSLAARRSGCQMIWFMLVNGFADDGFLVNNPNIASQFTGIGPDGGNGPTILTAAQLNGIAGLAEEGISRGEEIGWGFVQDYEIRWARGK